MFSLNNRPKILPCAFSYGGVKLEDRFEDYYTIKVKGRERSVLEFETDQVSIGNKIAAQKISSNTLVIEYLMYYEEIVEVKHIQRKLKQFLYREEDVPIIFDDDPQIIIMVDYQNLKKMILAFIPIVIWEHLKFTVKIL